MKVTDAQLHIASFSFVMLINDVMVAYSRRFDNNDTNTTSYIDLISTSFIVSIFAMCLTFAFHSQFEF